MADFAKTDSPEKKKEEEKKEELKPVAAADGEDGEEGDEDPEAESTAVFTPVVHLEAVEVQSGEEDEDILWKQRAKLFIFGETMLDKGTGKKQWNEKGVGDCKLLKNKESNHIRLLMRQEKTMKIIANHICDPRIELTPNQGASDRSWVWIAYDFSEGELEEKMFAIRFGQSESAQEFKAEFSKAQESMKAVFAGADSEEGKKEAEELAGALDKVAVKTEDSSPEKPKNETEEDPDL